MPNGAWSIDWGMWGTVFGFFGVLAFVVTIYSLLVNREDKLRERLDQYKWRQYHAKRLAVNAGAAGRYRQSLAAVSDRMDRVFGKRLIGWQALFSCVLIAILYPIVLFVVAFLFGGPNQMGGVRFFPEALDWWDRGWRVAFTLALLIGTYFWIRFVNDYQDGLESWLRKRLNLGERWSTGWRSEVLYIFSALVAGIGGTYVAARGAEVAGAGAVAGVIAGFFVGGGSFGARTLLLVMFMLFTISAIFGGSMQILLLFFVALPMINALIDMASWAVTRWFVRSAVAHGVTLVVLFEAFVDILLAGLCLIALTAALPNFVEFYNWIIPQRAVDWAELASGAKIDPFGAGFLVTGMLLTTLVPTAIHLFYGARGALAAPFDGQSEVAQKLADVPDENKIGDVDLENQVVSMIRRHAFKAWIVGVIVSTILLSLTLFVMWVVPKFGDFLYKVAMCSTWWKGNPCVPMLNSLGF